ncbi:MAG: C-GCAxxG-C-C family protein [Methanoregula sp.]|uniref:C-GCAxxG-C-C family protein n=1 Tax=Methanoregula sp. TaxID=2052170 RepID=UPI0025D9CC38|nr:C-GCAxxG-C-C family protein [Methanoregula sp.]MCK9631096.1 C-GCAxxG-C-C family protein [Methanoregula sp.]
MTTTKGEDAAALFVGGWSCSQAVCCAFAKDFGIDEKTALRLSCGLGGGMGHTGNACGAVSGALMVIGMKYGRMSIEDLASKEKTYEVAQKFVKEFRERNNSVNCSELLGHDLSDPEKLKAARETGVFKTICPKLVCDAGDILETLL